MIPMGEIVLFHLRHNGDVYLAHWYIWLIVILFVARLIFGWFDK